MIHDFRDYADESIIEADVCVIGAGAAGIALAHAFNNSNLKIVLLESGGFSREADTHELSRGDSVGLRHDIAKNLGRDRAFGGTTGSWAGQCIRLDQIDFEKRDWVPHSGWCLSKTELDEFYCQAEDFFALRDQVYDHTIWQKFGVEPLAFKADLLDTKFTLYTPRVAVAAVYRKSLEKSKNTTVLLHANVLKIETDENARTARHVRIASLCGKRGFVNARAFVLCGGGIENARLLLLSNDAQKNGLGNQHDLVGRFFQEHPNGHAAVVRTDAAQKLQDRYNLFYRNNVRYWAKIPLSPAAQRRERVLNANSQLVYDFDKDSGIHAARQVVRSLRRRQMPHDLAGTLGKIVGDLPVAGQTLARRYLRGKSPLAKPARIRLQVFIEQAPNPNSRVQLSPNKDRLGLRRAQIDWRLTELDRRTFQTMTAAVAAEFERLNLARVEPAEWLHNDCPDWQENVSDCYHHIGTTRMADNERAGVVDRDCKVFGISNLYVGGSSVFPTSGYANPTLTIVALALRLAAHLKRNLL